MLQLVPPAGLLQSREEAKRRVFEASVMRDIPMILKIALQVFHYVVEQNHVETVARSAGRQSPKSDDTGAVAAVRFDFTFTQQGCHQAIDIVGPAAPKAHKHSTQYGCIRCCLIQFSAPFLDLADEHVSFAFAAADGRVEWSR